MLALHSSVTSETFRSRVYKLQDRLMFLFPSSDFSRNFCWFMAHGATADFRSLYFVRSASFVTPYPSTFFRFFLQKYRALYDTILGEKIVGILLKPNLIEYFRSILSSTTFRDRLPTNRGRCRFTMSFSPFCRPSLLVYLINLFRQDFWIDTPSCTHLDRKTNSSRRLRFGCGLQMPCITAW